MSGTLTCVRIHRQQDHKGQEKQHLKLGRGSAKQRVLRDKPRMSAAKMFRKTLKNLYFGLYPDLFTSAGGVPRICAPLILSVLSTTDLGVDEMHGSAFVYLCTSWLKVFNYPHGTVCLERYQQP